MAICRYHEVARHFGRLAQSRKYNIRNAQATFYTSGGPTLIHPDSLQKWQGTIRGGQALQGHSTIVGVTQHATEVARLVERWPGPPGLL